MALEKAVASAVKTPGFYQSLNLAAGLPAAGLAGLRAILMAPKSSAGSITADTQVVRTVAGPDAVAGLLGSGTPGHLAAVALFRAYGLAFVDVVSPAASGGASATATITFTVPTAVTATQTVSIWIKGELIQVFWLVGETVSQIATKAAAAINGASSRVPVTASALAGVVTLTAKFGGAWGNDVLIRVTLADGTGGAVAASGSALSGGTGEPDFTNALTAISTIEYDFILPCVSNADATSAGGTSNPARIESHIETYLYGADAHYQQQVIGCTASLASAKTGAVARNHGPSQMVLCVNAESLGCEWAGWEVGRRMRAEAVDPAVNRIGELVTGLWGPVDVTADKPTAIEVEDALSNGVSILSFTAQDEPFMARPITTRSQDTSGNPDYRLLDVSGVSGSYAFMKDLRVTVPAEFAGAKLSPNQPPGSEPLPPNTVEERDIYEFVKGRAQTFVSRGILRSDKLAEALTNGTFAVRVDELDDSQVNIVLPFGIVRPLAKFSLVAKRVG